MTLDDVDAYVRMRCDSVMMAELGGPLPREGIEDKVRRDVEDVRSDRAWILMIVPDGAGEHTVAGTVTLWSHTGESEPMSEIGWMVLPEFQGKGLAKVAVGALLERAREADRWGVVHAFPGVSNAPSNGICRSLGFTLVGQEDVTFADRILRTNHWQIETSGVGGRAGTDAFGEELDRVLVHGRQPTRVRLVEYDERWPGRFSVERDRIVEALGQRALAVHHIGSTAVPGLAAKDRVDVCLEVADPDDEAAYLPGLLEAGYAAHVVEPGHRCLVRADPDDPQTNLHVYAAGADEVGRYLRFRDRLRSSAADRRRYEALKRELAEQEWPDVNYYAEAKGGLVREILAAADG